MNIGIQDAVNLHELALVVRGQAYPELLRSYEKERHHAAARTLRDTHLATTMSMLQSPWLRIPRDYISQRQPKVGMV